MVIFHSYVSLPDGINPGLTFSRISQSQTHSKVKSQLVPGTHRVHQISGQHNLPVLLGPVTCLAAILRRWITMD